MSIIVVNTIIYLCYEELYRFRTTVDLAIRMLDKIDKNVEEK